MRENSKKYFFYLVLTIIVLFGIFLRLKGLLINPPFWHDECALAWNIKFKSSLGLFGALRFLQIAPAFFLIFTKLLTKLFGFSEIVFRIIPFLTGCLSIVGFYFLSKKTLIKKHSILIAMLLFAINERLINYSFEFKPYNVDVLFTILGLLFFINLDLKKISLKKSLLFGTLLMLAPLFSFTSLFIIAGGFVTVFFKKIKSDLLKKACLMLPSTLSGVFYLIFHATNTRNMTHLANYWQNSFVTINPPNFFPLFIESLRYLFPMTPFLLFAFILLLWGTVIFGREKSTFLNTSAIGFFVLIAASLFHFYPFSNRLILFLIPIYLLLMMKPLDLISFNKKIKSILIIIITILAFGFQICATKSLIQAKTMNRGENPRAMMEFMVKKLNPSDIIFVNYSSNTEFAYYSSLYNIKNKLVQEMLTSKDEASYIKYLNSLKSGYYWFFLPYDSSYAPVFPYIVKWLQSQTIIYSAKGDRSLLIYAHVRNK